MGCPHHSVRGGIEKVQTADDLEVKGCPPYEYNEFESDEPGGCTKARSISDKRGAIKQYMSAYGRKRSSCQARASRLRQ